MSALQQFARVWKQENATTRKVLHAIPDDQGDYRPFPNVKTVRDLSFIFTLGQGGIAAALADQWQWPPNFPPVPPTLEEVQSAFDASTQAVENAIAIATDARLDAKVMFFVGPKQPGELSVAQLCWFMLHDTIHHRGQLSTYLRGMGAMVPSIYGPSADEPWM